MVTFEAGKKYFFKTLRKHNTMKTALIVALCLFCLGLTNSCSKDDESGPAKIHVTNTLWVNYRIFANGTELGLVPREGEATWEIDPGFYSFRAETENLNFLLDNASISENLEAGQTFHWTLSK